MPTVFEITTQDTNIRLDANRTGLASFNVNNISGRQIRGRFTVSADQPLAQDWLHIVKDSERSYDAGANDKVDVEIKVPATAAPGKFTFSIKGVDTDRPDDTLTQSPSVSFDVAAPVIKPKSLNPLLIIIPVIVVIVIIVILVIVLSPKGPSSAELTQTAVAIEQTAELTANAARTATAAPQQTTIAAQTQTRAAEIATQTAVGGSVATFTAIAGATQTQGAFMDQFVGQWRPNQININLAAINISRSGGDFTVNYVTCLIVFLPPTTPVDPCGTDGFPIQNSTTNVHFVGTALAATSGTNTLLMTRQGTALRVEFANQVFFFEQRMGVIATLIFVNPSLLDSVATLPAFRRDTIIQPFSAEAATAAATP